MNFFTQQARARRSTWQLILLFALALGGLIAGLYLVCGYLFSQFLDPKAGFWDPLLFAWVAGGTLALVGGGSLRKLAQLRSGGAGVARSLGGARVDPGTSDDELRQLVNVVEEMSVASGLPMPQVWVMESESGINAFAAGFHPGDAVIAVTRGCLRQLSRDELQGVIAHEFSHILNGDMRINIRLMGVLHGLLCLTIAGSILLRSAGGHRYGRSRSRGAGSILGLGLALIVAGYLGTLIARLIKAAISRQREFLADASAVQFTRNPDGIGGALQRIGGLLPARRPELEKGSRIHNPRAEEASHLFFGNALRRMSSLMATHPPILERIRRIQPGFRPSSRTAAGERTPQSNTAETAMAFAGNSLTPEQLVEQVGNPGEESLEISRQLLSCLPTELHEAAHDAAGAPALVLALLLHPRPAVRRGQMQRIQDRMDRRILRETIQLTPSVTDLRASMRLPLLDLTIPNLRCMSPAATQNLLACVDALIGEAEEAGFFQVCLRRVLLRHLRGGRRPCATRNKSHSTGQGNASEYRLILSCLAHVGHADEAAARIAYADGMRLLDLDDGSPGLQPLKNCRATRFEAAMNAIDGIPDLQKRKLLLACARAASSDGIIENAESELIRALADSFGCPLPPFRMTLAETNAAVSETPAIKTR